MGRWKEGRMFMSVQVCVRASERVGNGVDGGSKSITHL